MRLTAEEFEDFPQHGKILVVPLSLIARGLDIVIGTRSAVRSVHLCVRPLALPSGGASVPSQALAEAGDASRSCCGQLPRSRRCTDIKVG